MRILQSEFLFTRLPNGAPWTGFRDTVTVDGHPVRDRDAGLQQLVADGSDGALEQAARIVAENARYNLGDGFAFRTITRNALGMDGSVRLTPTAPDKTKVDYHVEIQTRGLLRMLEPLLRSEMAGNEARELVRLKGRLEEGSASTTAATAAPAS